MIADVDGNLARQKDLEVTAGVYVDSVLENSAAKDAGLEPGDVVVEIGGSAVTSVPELQEIVARHRPGDKIPVLINRDGKEKRYTITLKNLEGGTDVLAENTESASAILGVEFEEIDRKDAKKLGIEGGVKIKKLHNGKLKRCLLYTSPSPRD